MLDCNLYVCLLNCCHSGNITEKLNLRKADGYKYLKQSNCFSVAGVDDAERFHSVMVIKDA